MTATKTDTRERIALAAIVLAAAILRFSSIGSVSGDAFYDAAVRSMGLSLHNFYFGAFDPSALLSIDKPPLDLWLQVISVKVFGWGGFALKLPEALAGTLAVGVLYAIVRRVLGRPAALASAAALAVLPESVLTSRSDTMDSVMMLLVLVGLWLTVRAASTAEDRPRRRALMLAGVALGLAFNVKLMQSLLALPAFALLYWLAAPPPAGTPGATRRKLIDLAAAGGALTAVGLAWAIVASLAPGRHPWAIGSSDGSVWNAMFVFNGIGKVGGTPVSHRPGGPGLFRLFVSTGWHYDLLFGCVLLAAIAMAAAAAAVTLRRDHGPEARLARLFVLCLAVWTALGIFVFDLMTTVHARYLEALAPALAALIGWSAVVLAGLGPRRRPSLGVLAFTLSLTCLYTVGLHAQAARGAAALVIAAVGAGLLTRAEGRLGQAARWATAGLVVATVLVFPVHESFQLVQTQANDSLGTATASPSDIAALSRYLGTRTGGLRYELAVDEPLSLAPLIIADQRPILPLTSFAARPFTDVAGLQAAVSRGEVRFGLLGGYRCGAGNAGAAACLPAARWIRTHGVDVTAAAGLSRHVRLYRLVATA